MSIDQIKIGTYPNDGTGDSLRVSFDKINKNFVNVDSTISYVHDYANTINTVAHFNIDAVSNVAEMAMIYSQDANIAVAILDHNLGAAFLQANTSAALANGVVANATSAFNRSNVLYSVANNIYNVSNNVYKFSNSVYDYANTVNNSITDPINGLRRRTDIIYTFANGIMYSTNANFEVSNAAYHAANNLSTFAGIIFSYANGVNDKADTKLANTSGISYNGNLNFPSGNVTVGSDRYISAGEGRFGPYNSVNAAGGVFRTGAGNYALRIIPGGGTDRAASIIQFTDDGLSPTASISVNYNAMTLGTDIQASVILRTNSKTAATIDPNTQNVVFEKKIYATSFIDKINYDYFCTPGGGSRLKIVAMGNDQWHTSYPDNSKRLHFETNGPTHLMGGTSSQWYIRFGYGDGTTKSIMTGPGDIYTNGNITAYWSDKRLKKNIEKISDWRTILNNINGYRFEWNDLGKKMLNNDKEDEVEVGLLAQEVNEVLPQAAAIQMMQYKDCKDGVLIPKDDIEYDPENPYLTVRQEKIIPVLVEAIKGLMKEVDDLKAQLSEGKK